MLGLDVQQFREVSAIIVYPTAMQSRGVSAGPIAGTVSDGMIPVLGEAHGGRGPVLLAWDEALAAARDPGHGHNVVFHEFAHKLDLLDGDFDGSPPLDRDQTDAWERTCQDAFDDLQRGQPRPPLRPYGATNPAEFFAVATEAFFNRPDDLAQHEPDLYGELRSFYGQDPIPRVDQPSREPARSPDQVEY